MSKSNQIITAVAALALFAGLPVAAQQKTPQPPPPRLEITMTLLPENAKDPSSITRKIELPAVAQGKADGKRPAEIPGAEHGKGQGLDTAAEARERGRDFGQSVAEQARDNRENAGRRDDHPSGPPTDRPTPPNAAPPETPGRTKP